MKREAFRVVIAVSSLLFLITLSPFHWAGAEETLNLNELIEEALRNSPEILVSESKVSASGYRIPQAKSLPDPLFTAGYQNEGFFRSTLGDEPNAQGLFSLSQLFYFPGKRGLKGEMAAKDTESLKAIHKATQLRIASSVKQLYHDLLFAQRSIDILKERTELFSRIEDAATARYASGLGSQQEIIMAQTEKYMLMERIEMQKQKIQVAQGLLNTTLGRTVNSPLGRPVVLAPTGDPADMEDLLKTAKANSPEIRSREKLVEAAEAKVKLARKEYYPDFTLGAGYYPRTLNFWDMWNLTVTVNLPIYQKSKLDPALQEAQANLLGAKRELAATELILSSGIRENHSMTRTAERLMAIYKDSLIPKTYQDFQLALAGYASGKVEAITTVLRLKTLLDAEILYWGQYAEREKAIARLDAITGNIDSLPGLKEK